MVVRTDRHPHALSIRTFLLCFLTLCAAIVLRADNASPLILHNLGRAAAPLDGLWQFHTGDDPAWASPALDDSTWSAIEAGRPWETQGYRNYTGFAWYRRRLILPADGPHDFNLALFLQNR